MYVFKIRRTLWEAFFHVWLFLMMAHAVLHVLYFHIHKTCMSFLYFMAKILLLVALSHSH